MSCQACGAVIDCGSFGGVPGDLIPVGGFYATQDYTFLMDCPPGYYCAPGFYPRVITIPAGDIPGVTVGTFDICILSCAGMLCITIPIGISQSQTQALANILFQQWAQTEAACRVKKDPPAPGIPPPRLIPTIHNTRADVGNTQQCFTAHCTPESAGNPKQVCIPAGTYELTLLEATPELIASTQAQLNASALDAATKQATAQILCGVCNTQQSGSQFCPGNPGLVSSVIIPAGKYCQVGGDQFLLDSKAQADMVNQLAALQTGMGCACTITVDWVNRTFTPTCPSNFMIIDAVNHNLIAPPNMIAGVIGPFNFGAFYFGLTASCPGRCCFVPTNYTGPTFCLPYAPTSPGVCTS